MGLVRRVAFIAACALLASTMHTGTHAQTVRGPLHALYANMAPDLNLAIDYVMSSPNYCGAVRLRRNGMIHSHQQLYEARRELGMSLKELNLTARFNYPDDINCTFSVHVGSGWRVQLVFPMAMQLACSTDSTTCDCLEVFDGCVDSPLLKKICGRHHKVEPIESTSGGVTLRFQTDRNCKTSLGFQVMWYAFRLDDDMPCTNEEFRCDKHRCIPKYFLCDDTYHCLDKTDEGSTGCTYEQKICRIVSTIARYRGLVISILVLLLLAIVLGVILCVYYVVRRRSNQVACTRVLALKGGRKSDDENEDVIVVRHPAVTPTTHPVVKPIVDRLSQKEVFQPGCVRNPQMEP